MKHLLFGLFFTFLFISINVKAQQNHFVYIQADNKQPFYVRQDKNVYSSTASGYLVLAKLKSGSYDLVFGFPKNEWPEQNIHCTVEDKDLGYILKNFGDKGWGLFNLQSLNVLMANENKKNDVAKEVRTDAFSNMLSTVVNDPTIKESEPVKQETKKTFTEEPKPNIAINSEPAKEEIKKETKKTVIEDTKPNIVINSNLAKEESEKVVKVEQKSEPIKVAETVAEKINDITKQDATANKVNISKKLANTTAEGFEMIYVVINNGIQDTIRILIPIEKEISESSREKPIVINKPKEDVKVIEPVNVLKEEKKKDAKFLEIELPNPNGKVIESKSDSIVQQAINKSPMINSDCKNLATNNDFLKLRKKMAAAENPDEMIVVAKKIFKTECFTTEQLKNLSVLFLNDSGKYSFFDAAYPFVSDSQNYTLLEGQLTETYYINRFRVMIKH